MSVFGKVVQSLLHESTAASDVSFVPAHVGVVSALRGKLSKKKHWKLSMKEDPILKEYVIGFDDEIVKVKHADWSAFQDVLKGFGRVESHGDARYFSVMSSLVTEATAPFVQERAESTVADLKATLKASPCVDTGRQLSFFGRVFSATEFVGSTVAILYNDEDHMIERLSEDISSSYKDDLGAYDMLSASLRQKQSLKFAPVINAYKYLYGADAIASYRGAAVKYECYTDLNFIPHEQIQILGVETTLHELDGYDGVKLYGNVLYPRGKHFSYRFIQRMKEELDTEL